jgi:hypothetical protein
MNTEYPKNVICDFRKLGKESLMKIIKHYAKDNKYISPDMSRIDLAAAVAKIFSLHHPMELDTLDHFASQHCLSTMDVNIRSGGKTAGSGSGVGNNKTQTPVDTNFERMKLDGEPARVGEQVAAKASADGDADAWILVNVLSYDPVRNSYLVQDEDDSSGGKNEPSAAITVSAATHVKRLHDSAAHLHKGDSVLAVFPDTTSFYRGVVVRNPRPPGEVPAASGKSGKDKEKDKDSGWDVVVRFDDDEDDTGRSPPRRIPARFILLVADAESPNLIQGAHQAQPAVGNSNSNGNARSGTNKKRSSAQMDAPSN